MLSKRRPTEELHLVKYTTANSAALGEIYGHCFDGFIYSHSRSDDNNKLKSHLRFDAGDVVKVQLDPKFGRVTYSKDGLAEYVQ